MQRLQKILEIFISIHLNINDSRIDTLIIVLLI